MKKIISCLVIYSLLLLSGCAVDEAGKKTLSVTTDTPTNITATNVTLGGNVTNDGGSTVTSKGVCISLSVNPTIDDPNDLKLEIGTGVGAYSDSYTGFDPSTTYHVRAYATNSSGTVYGEDRAFTMLASTGFSVTTDTPSNITGTDVTLGGNATNDGGSTITSKGVCLS
ncbi:MAG TPA: hypothetical protein VL443_09205, partial [Cyclobacteriaceae bacterium]|nr:hypothetical protein [Cyclobacteriaceae bacterium]